MPYTELYHHGINGQRWGFRRFQNEDGSLTPEGELRYNQGKQKLARGKAAEMYKTKKYKAKLKLKEEKQKVKAAAEVAKTAKKEQAKLNAEDRVIRKKPKNMTDEELRNEVNRLAMELDYEKKSWQLKNAKNGPGVIDKMDEFFERPTGRIVANLGSNIIQQVATQSLTNIIKEKTSSIEKEKLKGQKLKNKKLKAEAKKAEKEYDSLSGESDKTKNKEKTNSDVKSTEDYLKDAMSGKKSQTFFNDIKEDAKSVAKSIIKKKDTGATPETPVDPSKIKSSKDSYSIKNEQTYKTTKFSNIDNYNTKTVGTIPTIKTDYDLFGQAINVEKNDPISIVLNDEQIKKIFK